MHIHHKIVGFHTALSNILSGRYPLPHPHLCLLSPSSPDLNLSPHYTPSSPYNNKVIFFREISLLDGVYFSKHENADVATR